jgi:TAT-translocated FGD2 family F420-dependent dehydrogenase
MAGSETVDGSRPRRVGFALANEQFPPGALVEWAVAAEQAGFDLVWCADHFHPWMDNQGHACHAFVVMAALAQRTRRITFGTGVTCPSFRYRPAEVAQAFATLGALSPGRVFLGIGSGEALNEVPAGGGWGTYRERTDRMVEAVQLIQRLFSGEWVTFEGRYYQVRDAKLYDLPPQPVPIYLAASGPKSARVVGEHGDGWITFGDTPLQPPVRAAYEEGARAAGKDPGAMPIILEHYVVVGGRAEAEEAARYWRFMAVPLDLLTIPDPREIQRKAEESVTLEQVYADWPVSEDPQVHLAALERYFAAGVTDIIVHSGQQDQERVIRFYGEQVLPLLRTSS